MTHLILLLALAAAPKATVATAAPPNIAAMFASLEGALQSCEGAPGPTTVRASLTAWPDGSWALGLADILLPTPNLEVEARAQSCLAKWVADARRRQPRLWPHKAPTLYVHELHVPGSEELAIARLDASLGNVQACRRTLMPPIGELVKARVRLTCDLEGVLTVAPVDVSRHPLAKALVACAAKELASVGAGPLAAPISVEREIGIRRNRVKLPNADGSAGALCQIGERGGLDRPWEQGVDEVVPPAACKPGLRCCSGGAAGSDGHCVAGPHCPLVP